jgi:hypothetical protein
MARDSIAARERSNRRRFVHEMLGMAIRAQVNAFYVFVQDLPPTLSSAIRLHDFLLEELSPGRRIPLALAIPNERCRGARKSCSGQMSRGLNGRL